MARLDPRSAATFGAASALGLTLRQQAFSSGSLAMRRLGLAVVLAGSLTSPVFTVAQQEGKVIRIGILGTCGVG